MEYFEDDRITNARNRVFTNDIAIGKDSPNAMSTVSTSVYRVIGRITGTGQIEDIISCGYVRPKQTPLNDRHHNQLFWTKGGKKTFYMGGNRMVLEAPEEKVQDNQIGAIPFEDLIAIWVFDTKQNRYVNRIDYYKSLYHQLHSSDNNLDWGPEENDRKKRR